MSEKLTDRHGLCPHCHSSLDGGDIKEELSKLSVFANYRPQDIAAMAYEFYGWTPENRKRFTALVGIELIAEKELYLQCTQCRWVFNSTTGEGYVSMLVARGIIPAPETVAVIEEDVFVAEEPDPVDDDYDDIFFGFK